MLPFHSIINEGKMIGNKFDEKTGKVESIRVAKKSEIQLPKSKFLKAKKSLQNQRKYFQSSKKSRG